MNTEPVASLERRLDRVNRMRVRDGQLCGALAAETLHDRGMDWLEVSRRADVKLERAHSRFASEVLRRMSRYACEQYFAEVRL